jgi:tRNA(fMet)-specific endonuclease VapC
LFHIVDQYRLHTSTIVEFELFVGATTPEKVQDIEYILQFCTIIPLTSEIVQYAARLYQRLTQTNKRLEIRDVLIASTAVIYNLPVMTLNREHFERIESLKLLPLPIVTISSAKRK